MKSSLLIVGIASFVASCATDEPMIYGLEVNPSFTYAALEEGSVAVGGVASALSVLPDAERNRLAEMLRRELRDARPELEIMSAGRVSNMLGADAYRQLMDEFRSTGELSWRQDMSSVRAEARYVALARFEGDQSRRDRNVHRENDEPFPSYRDEEDEKTRVAESDTSREVTISLRVFDLDRQVCVWSGVAKEFVVRSNRIESEEVGGLEGAFLDAVLGADHPDYPDAPNLDPMLETAFSYLVSALPEPPENEE